MKPLASYPVVGLVRVIEQGSATHNGNDHVIRIGAEINIDTKLLDAYCFSSPTDFTYDLMTIIGAVKYADRSIKRSHADGWGRKISIEAPVLTKSIWAEPTAIALLEDCLGYLTGDEWHFSFRHRKNKPKHIGQVNTPLVPSKPHVFVPYSHGLDSYAQVRLLQQREPDTEVVCVFTDSKPNTKGWRELCRSKPRGGIRAIKVPVDVDKPHHAEPTFRSRPFTYYLLSAYGALLNGTNRVLIPENGQGSLGGTLVPLGDEAQHRSCHPGFTTRLSQLLQKLTGQRVDFEHTALFQTKGQVMSALYAIEPSSNAWLLEHWSCSHDQRHANHDGVRVHCGACGNCILRRASARIAGIDDITKYKFSNLTADALENAVLDDGDAPREIKSFRDLAGNSIRSMQRMADLADEPQSTEIWSEAAGLAQYMEKGVKIIHGQLVGLLQEHQKEWKNFLAECGDQSWIVQMAKG
jgi:hypothetical protein